MRLEQGTTLPDKYRPFLVWKLCTSQRRRTHFFSFLENGIFSASGNWTIYSDLQSILKKIAMIYGVTFLFVLPLLCHDLPYSKYFVPGSDLESRVLANNQKRVDEAELYLSSLKNEPLKSKPESENLRIAIGVISVSRQTKSHSTKYLTQVMARLHETVTRLGVSEEVFMFICYSEKVGGRHLEAEHLARYFKVKRFPPNRRRRVGWRHEEERENYIFCLESAAKYNAKYVLLLQDDALPHTNFYEVLDYLIDNRLERRVSLGRSMDGVADWVWLKLNFPDELANFHRSPFFAYEWIALSLTTAGIIAFLYHVIQRRDEPTPKQNSTGRHHYAATNVVFMLSFVYFLLASWVIGRPYFLRLFGLSKYFTRLSPGTSCCLPAVLYPGEQVQGLITYLNGVTCKPGFPLDFALDAYRQKTQLRQYLAVPNTFSHIGYYSALHGGTNSRSAYAFLDS